MHSFFDFGHAQLHGALEVLFASRGNDGLANKMSSAVAPLGLPPFETGQNGLRVVPNKALSILMGLVLPRHGAHVRLGELEELNQQRVEAKFVLVAVHVPCRQAGHHAERKQIARTSGHARVAAPLRRQSRCSRAGARGGAASQRGGRTCLPASAPGQQLLLGLAPANGPLP